MDAITLLIGLRTLMFILNNPDIKPTIEQKNQIEELRTYLNTTESSKKAQGEEKVKKTKKDKKKTKRYTPEVKTKELPAGSSEEIVPSSCVNKVQSRTPCVSA